MKLTSPLRSSLLLTPVILTIAFTAPAEAAEVALQDCPPAVQDAINANRNGGRIEEIDYSAARGLYDVDIHLGPGRDLDLVISSAGTLLKSVEDIALGKAPRSVKNSIRRLMQGGGRIDDLDIETAGGRVTYRVEIDFPNAPDLNATLSKKGLVLKRNRRD